MNCEYCQSTQHAYLNCPKKPDGWKPERMARRSTAARKDVPVRKHRSLVGPSRVENSKISADAKTDGTQAHPVDTMSSNQILERDPAVGHEAHRGGNGQKAGNPPRNSALHQGKEIETVLASNGGSVCRCEYRPVSIPTHSLRFANCWHRRIP